MELYLCRQLPNDDSSAAEKQWVRFPEDGSMTVGRSAECDLRLFSTHISRNHALLKRSLNEFSIKDENSLWGVHVNGTRIISGNWHVLRMGDKIEFGRPDEPNLDDNVELKMRFVYRVRQAISMDLNEKRRGPKCHTSAAFEKQVTSLTKRKLSAHKNQTVVSSNSHQSGCMKILAENAGITQSDVMQRNECVTGNDMSIKVKKLDNVEPAHGDDSPNDEVARKKCKREKSPFALDANMEKNKLCVEEIEGKEMTSTDVERENERLKIELEKKELALQEEINERNKKLEEEQKKIAQELEKDFKIKFGQKEEELETRLMLEKDIAIEECQAKIQEKEKASTSIESVVNTMENELQCSICSELFVISTTLNCAHTFCEYCITEWRSVRNICPVCRQPIQTATRSLVLDNYIDKVLENLSSERKEMRVKLIEERKQLMKEKNDSRNATANRNRSQQAQSHGRGNRNRGHVATVRHVTTRSNSRSNRGARGGRVPVTINVSTTHPPIVISSDESSDSDYGDDDDSSSVHTDSENEYDDPYNYLDVQPEYWHHY